MSVSDDDSEDIVPSGPAYITFKLKKKLKTFSVRVTPSEDRIKSVQRKKLSVKFLVLFLQQMHF